MCECHALYGAVARWSLTAVLPCLAVIVSQMKKRDPAVWDLKSPIVGGSQAGPWTSEPFLFSALPNCFPRRGWSGRAAPQGDLAGPLLGEVMSVDGRGAADGNDEAVVLLRAASASLITTFCVGCVLIDFIFKHKLQMCSF